MDKVKKLTNVKISVIQVNLNKAHAAQLELLRKINKLKSYIIFATEPYCYKRQLSMLPKNCNYLPQIKTGHPRAAIFASKDIQIHEINELKHRDLTAGLITIEGK